MELIKKYDLGNSEIALKNLLQTLKRVKKFYWHDIKPINKNRYYIIKGYKENILVMFKREVFFNFSQTFKDKKKKGVGDTINVSDLQLAIQNNVDTIYTIFPNGHIYSIPLNDFLIKSEKWQNKEGKFVRSISIHEYKRLKNG